MTDDLPFPLRGSTLITGPSNAGKTRLTALALRRWVEREGSAGVVVLEFAPELERDGRVLGGRLDRFGPLPTHDWIGVVEAHAPRAEGADVEAAFGLARSNAARARAVLDAAPADPRAVFVNDATIPFQAGAAPTPLTDYCERATVAVLNAFESDELGTDDPVSRYERAARETLEAWADRHVRLD
ncbi:MAG: hypothetical protein ABEJ23_05665 [Haloarculaceae archaeon]